MFTAKTEISGLTLTLADPRYAEALFALVDKNRGYLRQWLPWLDHNQTVEDSDKFLRGCQASYAAQSELNVLIFFEDTLVGITGFNAISHLNRQGEIGYWLGEEFNGRGFMTAAVARVIELGFEKYNLNRQVIRAATGNRPSQKVAKRLGFTYEGTQREAGYLYGKYEDLEMYSLLKHEWPSNRPSDGSII